MKTKKCPLCKQEMIKSIGNVELYICPCRKKLLKGYKLFKGEILQEDNKN